MFNNPVPAAPAGAAAGSGGHNRRETNLPAVVLVSGSNFLRTLALLLQFWLLLSGLS